MSFISTHLSGLFHTRKFFHLLAISILVFTAGIIMAQEVPATSAGKPGRISGVVFDSKSGEKLPGVTIMVQLPGDTVAQVQGMSGKTISLGAKSNLNGEYLVRSVPPGIYTITVSMIGYAKSVISEVEVTPDGIAKLDVSLSTEEVRLKDEIKVKGKRDPRSTSATDAVRIKASSSMDFVSQEQISRAGAGDAQSALSKVTGVSLMGDQAYVRGLADRYINVQVDGSTMPTSDPDKQSFRSDIFSSSLIDNISIQKTATPDQPGTFTGGGINLTTKSYPEQRSLSFKSSVSYDNLANLNDDFATYNGSKGDVWGYDDGTRAIPQYIKDNLDRMPGTLQNPNVITEEQRNVGDSVISLLSNEIEASKKKSPLNRDFGVSYGDNLLFFGRSLGVVATGTYNRTFSFYDDGIRNRYIGGENTVGEPFRPSKVSDVAESKDEVMIGLLGTLSYSIADNHDLNFRYVKNQNGETVTRFGDSWEQSTLSNPFDRKATTNLLYEERSLESFQLRGGHQLARIANSGIKLEWMLSTSSATQDEPDQRRFVELHEVNGDGVLDTTVMRWTTPSSERYWRYMDEENREAKVDLTLPVTSWLKFKTGYNLLVKDRHRETFDLQLVNEDRPSRVVGRDSVDLDTVVFNGNWEEYIDQAGGVLLYRDSTLRSNGTYTQNYYWGLYYATYGDNFNQNSYNGTQDVSAWYGMADFSLFNKLKVITGARREKTNMAVYAIKNNTKIAIYDLDSTHYEIFQADGKTAYMDVSDWLPSANLVYALGERTNVRGAYSKTLARPSLREFSPAEENDFAEADRFAGNVRLRRTLIDNYDVRYEWFARPGEIFAISGFAKKFKDPIEWGFRGGGTDPVILPTNVQSGTLYGAEFEIRKRLDFFGNFFRNFFVGGNLTLTTSDVDLSSEEAYMRDSLGLSTDRPLQGQPSSVVNMDITYNNPKMGTRATVLFNHVAEQLYINAATYIPDVYEESRSILDITVSQSIFAGFSLSLSAKNITNEPIVRYYHLPAERKVIDELGNPVDKAIYESYSKGSSFSAGLSWQIW